jgi:hypothetical protein
MTVTVTDRMPARDELPPTPHPEPGPCDPPAALDRVADQAVRALTEAALLADALDRRTHRFELDPVNSIPAPDWCGATDPDTGGTCGRPPAADIHRTPDLIRAELAGLHRTTIPDVATLERLRDGLARIGDLP